MIDFIRIPELRLKILRNDKKIQEQIKKLADVEIKFNDEVQLEGETLQVLRVKEVIKAFGRGFDFNTALNLLDEDFYLYSINIKDFAGKSRRRLVTLKGRIIGTRGKTKKLIEQLTGTKLSIFGKTINIIGKWNNVTKAKEAVEMLLSGSLHSTVYRFLERKARE